MNKPKVPTGTVPVSLSEGMFMKKTILFLLFLAVQIVLFAQGYFPEGTKWTEIRLDTLKYDSWYSKVGDEWVPNFETIEYCVQGEHPDRDWVYKKVYSNGPEWKDSLTLMISETEYDGHRCVLVSVPVRGYNEELYVPWPGEAYQFDWNVGVGIYYEDITMSNITSIGHYRIYFGIIEEIKEGYFGSVGPWKYVELNGRRIIQGIGITEWDDGECLFGPSRPYFALSMLGYDCGELYPERHYRSMLVHFERNKEVLYNVWPDKSVTDGMNVVNRKDMPASIILYDLQGRQLQGKPTKKGVYIYKGKKVTVK